MTKCIYRPSVALNSDKPENDSTASLEHIIPFAIGGSNSLATMDACKKANNDLGSEVDAPFCNILPIAIKRHELAIVGQSGNIPDIVWSATSESGARARVTIHPDMSLDFEMSPTVDTKTENIFVSGTADRVKPIIEGILRGAKKRGETLHSTAGTVLSSLDDCLQVAEVEIVDKVRCSVQYFDHEAWVRGLMKIALGVGHVLLGPEWTFSSDGELIRGYAVNKKEAWPKKRPRGYVYGEWPRSLRVPFGKTKDVRDAMYHTVAISPQPDGEELYVAISLFGGLGVPEAFFSIGRKSGFLKVQGELMAAHLPIGFRVNPRDRKVETITIRDADARVARLGPSN